MVCQCTGPGHCPRHDLNMTPGMIARCQAGKFNRPTVAQTVANYALSTVKHATDRRLVSLEVREQRATICSTCPHNIDDVCELCNCPLKKTILGDKLRRAVESCPLGKWSSVPSAADVTT